MKVEIPGAKLLSSSGSGANARGHHHAKAREVAIHRAGANAAVIKALCALPGYSARWTGRTAGKALLFVAVGPSGRYPARSVAMVRIAPKRHAITDRGNLWTALKATQDGIADALGVDDRDPEHGGPVAWDCRQEAGEWGLRIEIE